MRRSIVPFAALKSQDVGVECGGLGDDGALGLGELDGRAETGLGLARERPLDELAALVVVRRAASAYMARMVCLARRIGSPSVSRFQRRPSQACQPMPGV